MNIIAAQMNPLVGDIEGNTEKIIAKLEQLSENRCDLIIFPELCITGYPPEDLLLRPHLYTRCNAAIQRLQQATQKTHTAIIVGYPEKIGDACFNKAACIHQGTLIAERIKEQLPNYSVFDEKRYFTTLPNTCVFNLNGTTIGLLICEDIWFSEPAEQAKHAGAELLIVINASPYDQYKPQQRNTLITQRVNDLQVPIIYLNCVGGQDELVFDGGSFAMNANSIVAAQSPYYIEHDLFLTVTSKPIQIVEQTLPTALTQEAAIYQALVLGVRDYITKNHFPSAIIGLSGGIDSALTLAIAVDAIGADRVTGVLMPSRYTSWISNEDAIRQAIAMGVTYKTISIEPLFQTFLTSLETAFEQRTPDTTEENIQARIRGTLLMALSNKFGAIVLTTGNKSELSVGYATLYGDMCGGFSVLKDIPKTLVYRLSSYRNTQSAVIPERVITRAPSAELKDNQTDQDSLPDYDTLDAIIYWYIDQDLDVQSIIAKGFDEATVKRMVKLIHRNEYKRRQAAPGIRISKRAFGKDRRYPITSGY